jgi:hypothetical protein
LVPPCAKARFVAKRKERKKHSPRRTGENTGCNIDGQYSEAQGVKLK